VAPPDSAKPCQRLSPLGSVVLLLVAVLLFAVIGPGSALGRYLVDRDPGVSISGPITSIGVDFSCFGPQSSIAVESPICHGVRVLVTHSSDEAAVAVGSVVAVSTTSSLDVGDAFTGSTPATSHRNIVTTFMVISAALALAGVGGVLIWLIGRRRPVDVWPSR
jgi:hypothetical protein